MSELRGQIEKLNAQLRATQNRAENSLLQSNQANEMSVALEEVEREREILKQVGILLEKDVFLFFCLFKVLLILFIGNYIESYLTIICIIIIIQAISLI